MYRSYEKRIRNRAQIAFKEDEEKLEAISKNNQMFSGYSKLIGLKINQNYKSVLEFKPKNGMAMLTFCMNFEGTIIDNNPNRWVREFAEESRFNIIEKDINTLDELPNVDEIWILNQLNDIEKPVVFVDLCKKHGKTIRFFEPINIAPHFFTLEDFIVLFSNVKYYKPKAMKFPSFYDIDCAYGIHKV